MSLSNMTALETLDVLARKGGVRRGQDGRYTVEDFMGNFVGIVKYDTVLRCVTKRFVIGEPLTFGCVMYTITESGRQHLYKCAQLRMKFGRRSRAPGHES